MSICIEDLTVKFKNGVTAINHANLDIPNGILGLLGENGAGKTTLMRVLKEENETTNAAGMSPLPSILAKQWPKMSQVRDIWKPGASCPWLAWIKLNFAATAL